MCEACLPGKTDEHSSATTPCARCARGQYNYTAVHANGYMCMYAAGSNACVFCSAGTADADSDASTPCSQSVSYRHVRTRDAVRYNQCNECVAGQYWQHAGSNRTGHQHMSAVRIGACRPGRGQHDWVRATCMYVRARMQMLGQLTAWYMYMYVRPGRSMTTLMRAPYARCVVQETPGPPDPELPLAHAHSASQVKQMRTATVLLDARPA